VNLLDRVFPIDSPDPKCHHKWVRKPTQMMYYAPNPTTFWYQECEKCDTARPDS
jgi:hypothetical protein